MRKFLIPFSLLFLIMFSLACKHQSASDYNNKIIKQQIEITKKIDNLKKAIDDYNVLPQDTAIKEMNVAYDSTMLQIDKSLKIVRAMPAFKKDSLLKSSAINLFNAYQNIVMKNYKQVIELYKLPDAMFTKDDADKLKFLLKDANDKMNTAFSKFSETQKSFAKKFNLNLN